MNINAPILARFSILLDFFADFLRTQPSEAHVVGMTEESTEITDLLKRAGNGDESAVNELFLLYIVTG